MADLSTEAAAIAAAGEVLGGRGVFGLAWIDRELIVRRLFGRLAGFIPLDTPLTESLLPLFGLDEEIRALAFEPGRVLEIPSVAIRMPGAPQAHLNIMMLWAPAQDHYLLVISRSPKTTEVESQLAAEIRRRLIAERDATALAGELARANRDLEEFASIISHDLMSPLRALRHLVEQAETLVAAGNAVAAGRSLAQVRDQSSRLSGMLRGLFDYSRAGHKGDVVTRVDTRALVETIVRSMPPRQGLSIEITGDWREIATLAAPLDLVLRNLIDNAVKHHGGSSISIVVTSGAHNQVQTFSVADDGPGIDPRHHAAILLPFRRLNEEAGDGGGMGLALVNRTLQQMGGRLEIASDPAQRKGATFTVYWPLQLNT